MTRAVPIALLMAVALGGGAADARCAKKGCRKMRGPRVTLRATVPMVAASLGAAAGGDAQGPTGSAQSPTPSPDPSTTAPPPAKLGVVAREWSLVLSRSALPAGQAIVQLQNFGEDAHNLRIERVDGGGSFDVPLAESGELQRAEGAVTAGDYRIYCSLPGHEAQGMRARLTVTP
jgi:hypothetical protein